MPSPEGGVLISINVNLYGASAGLELLQHAKPLTLIRPLLFPFYIHTKTLVLSLFLKGVHKALVGLVGDGNPAPFPWCRHFLNQFIEAKSRFFGCRNAKNWCKIRRLTAYTVHVALVVPSF